MRELYNYVDCIIPQYVKVVDDYYDVDVKKIDQNEISHLIDQAMKHDVRFRNYVLCSLQELIDERLFDYKYYVESGESTADDYVL